MDSDTETFCNSNKNHLQLQLEQPTPFADDIRHLDTSSNPDEDEEKEKEDEVEAGEAVDGEDTKTIQSALTKIPLLYQVEPGCTPLSCYSAIATFIVMTMGIFWLLLISPPKNAVPMTVIPGLADVNQVYDYPDSYDSSYSTLMPETVTTTARETTTEILLPLDEAVQDAPQSLVLGDS